jgi:hypothetical protein
MNRYINKVIIGLFSTVALSFLLTQLTHDLKIQNAYCASQESPKLREEMKPVIRRDCLGELDREQFAKTFAFLLVPSLGLSIFTTLDTRNTRRV